MNTDRNRLADRYQEFADDFQGRSRITFVKIAANCSVASTIPVLGYLVQEQLMNPAYKFAVAAGALAVTGARLKWVYLAIEHEGILHDEYRHFKGLSLSQAGDMARPE